MSCRPTSDRPILKESPQLTLILKQTHVCRGGKDTYSHIRLIQSSLVLKDVNQKSYML